MRDYPNTNNKDLFDNHFEKLELTIQLKKEQNPNEFL